MKEMKGMLLCAFALPAISHGAEFPAPIQALSAHGAEVVEAFDAPGELQGYVMQVQGRSLTAYVTGDGRHVIVGTLLDAQGVDLSAAARDAAMSGDNEDAWNLLEKSHWIADGDADAPRVIYTFTDANCPFCHQFWEAARPWVEAGHVQIRHVIVAMLRPDSLPRGAAMLGDEDPSEALSRHNQQYEQGGIRAGATISDDASAQVEKNNALMRKLGIGGTPATYYQDENKRIIVRQGVLRGAVLENVMGGPRP
ncbi:MAG: thiol:disulfide interchange protein DsbG [Alcanivorax sp.]|nr:thiol:disulfide interchange protein DsbG [Alcanivorax sp.]